MGKIYEGDTKLTVVQVCSKLANDVNTEQAIILSNHIQAEEIKNSRKCFAHAVLDAYRLLPNKNDADMEIKKLCKHLMDKYMKSTASNEQDIGAYHNLINIIMDKAKGTI